jgi:hypothetical protein
LGGDAAWVYVHAHRYFSRMHELHDQSHDSTVR